MDMSAIWSQGQDLGGGESGDAADWRTLLPEGSRQRIVNEIMMTLMRHLPFAGEDGMKELEKIAAKFEEKTYSAATSPSDYLGRIYYGMLKLERDSQNPPASYPFIAASYNQNPQYPAAGDWRTQLPAYSRQRIVENIMMTLMRHLPFAGEDGMKELEKEAAKFEEKTYSAATSPSDYLGRISYGMLKLERDSQNPPASYPFIAASYNQNPQYPAAGDWRTQLPAYSRQRIVENIMMTLMRHLPCTGEDGMKELEKIAVRFEEKAYSAATSQSDYLRKISLKMMAMETRSQNSIKEFYS